MVAESKGLLDSVATFLSTLIGVAHTRLELLSNDLEEDRERLLSIVTMYLAAAFCFVVGIVLLTILIIFVLWESHRLLALFLFAGFFMFIGSIVWCVAAYKKKSKPKLFSASLLELLKDKGRL